MTKACLPKLVCLFAACAVHGRRAKVFPLAVPAPHAHPPSTVPRVTAPQLTTLGMSRTFGRTAAAGVVGGFTSRLPTRAGRIHRDATATKEWPSNIEIPLVQKDKTNLHRSTLVECVVVGVEAEAVAIDCGGTIDVISKKDVSSGIMYHDKSYKFKDFDLTSLFEVGEPVKAIAIGKSKLSIRALEEKPGDLITDKKAVFDRGLEMAAKYRFEMKKREPVYALPALVYPDLYAPSTPSAIEREEEDEKYASSSKKKGGKWKKGAKKR